MARELERRFALSETQLDVLLRSLSWSPPTQVRDLTFGPTGATSMQTHGWVLRLRESDGAARLEYKAPSNSEWTAWQEYGVSIGDFRSAAVILQKAELAPGLLIDRMRRRTRWRTLELSLDTVEMLGDFIELESTEEREFESDVAALWRAVPVLDRLMETRPYGELLLDALRIPAIADEHKGRLARVLARE